jgi:hypothetical protein
MKEKAEYEKRVLLDEDEERDEGDCPSPSRRTFFSPLLLSVSPPYALVCFFFFVMGSLLCFLFSVVSPVFFFFLPYFLLIAGYL